MKIGVDIGRDRVELDIDQKQMLPVRRQLLVPSLSDPAAAVSAALEKPLSFPALRRALTPDDHVAVAVDERLPHLAQLLVPILEHVTGAGVAPHAIALVCPASSSQQAWLEELPEAYEDVQVESHDPANRKRLSYVATMRRGRRLYMNRTIVDADQVVVLAAVGYDPLLGYTGSEGFLYPAFGDEETQQAMCEHLTGAIPSAKHWPVRREATEAAWLLGAPFFVQVIEGPGEDLVHVIGGPADSSEQGQQLQDAQWRIHVAEAAGTVVAALNGDPQRQSFADLARAAACAARVVRTGGRIVLLAQGMPQLAIGAALLRQASDPAQALTLLRQHKPADMAAAFQWAQAAEQARIYLLSGLPDDTVEELFAVPLQHAGQVQRLVNEGGSVLVLNDAHKMLAVVQP